MVTIPGRNMDGLVREATPSEAPDMQAIGLPALIGTRQVDFLKMDIEGSEAELFADPSWLNQVDALIVETHYGRTGPPTEGIVTEALRQHFGRVTVRTRHIGAERQLTGETRA